MDGCCFPLVKLKALSISNVLPQGSGTSLLLTPNLEHLELTHWFPQDLGRSLHCLGYMLSPDGMLGPIRALKSLRLTTFVLSNKDQEDYCTRHLRLHPCLENLTFRECQLPMDFVQLMPNPVTSSDGFLPNLKELHFERCEPQNPSKEWLTKLKTARPQLTVASY